MIVDTDGRWLWVMVAYTGVPRLYRIRNIERGIRAFVAPAFRRYSRLGCAIRAVTTRIFLTTLDNARDTANAISKQILWMSGNETGSRTMAMSRPLASVVSARSPASSQSTKGTTQ